MRTTIDVPPDLHSVLSSLAASNRKSLSQTAVELMRRGLDQPTAAAGAAAGALRVSPATGLPVVRLPRAISAEDIRALDDEA